jgi:hypothetical protein
MFCLRPATLATGGCLGVASGKARSALSVTDPASWAEHRPISEYRHAGNFPCRSNVARGSPRLFTDKLLTSRQLHTRNPGIPRSKALCGQAQVACTRVLSDFKTLGRLWVLIRRTGILTDLTTLESGAIRMRLGTNGARRSRFHHSMRRRGIFGAGHESSHFVSLAARSTISIMDWRSAPLMFKGGHK